MYSVFRNIKISEIYENTRKINALKSDGVYYLLLGNCIKNVGGNNNVQKKINACMFGWNYGSYCCNAERTGICSRTNKTRSSKVENYYNSVSR